MAGDLSLSQTPIQKVLRDVDPRLARPLRLTQDEFDDLVEFVRTGLLDPRATPERLLDLVPRELPSGLPLHEFQADE